MRGDQEVAGRTWTAFGIVSDALVTLRRHLLAGFVLLGLFPSVWSMLPQLYLPAGAVPRAPWLALALSFARLAWNALPTPMEFLVALRLTGHLELRAGELLRSFRRPSDAVIIGAVTALPGQFSDLARTLGWMAIALPTALVGGVALVRFIVAMPVLVATGCSSGRALSVSWSLTRGQAFRVVRTLVLLAPPTMGLYIFARRNLLLEHAIQSLVNPVLFLVTTHVYLALGGTVTPNGAVGPAIQTSEP